MRDYFHSSHTRGGLKWLSLGGGLVSINSSPSLLTAAAVAPLECAIGWSDSSMEMEYSHHEAVLAAAADDVVAAETTTTGGGGCSNETARCLRKRPSMSGLLLLLANLLLRKLPGRDPFSLLRRDEDRCGWWRDAVPRRLGRLPVADWCTDSALALRPMLPTERAGGFLFAFWGEVEWTKWKKQYIFSIRYMSSDRHKQH